MKRVTSMTDADELYLSQTENRHLKNTIVALRDELENMRIQHEENVQQALVSANDEIHQLKAAIVAMRDELEHSRAGYEDQIQNIHRTARDEINQLHQSIWVLRERIEAYEKK
jgi:HAMP domain-containing protein